MSKRAKRGKTSEKADIKVIRNKKQVKKPRNGPRADPVQLKYVGYLRNKLWCNLTVIL